MRGHTLSAFVKLLVFAVVTVLATAVLAVTISNRTFGSTRSFRAMFTDVTGLLPGDSVRAAGVRVGTVTSIKVVHDRYAEVGFNVDNDVPVTQSSRLQVRYLNLVGQRYIALLEQPGDGTRQPSHALIPLSRTAPALDLTALFNGFRPLLRAIRPQDVNQLSYEIIQVLQGEGGNINQLLANTASLTSTIADRDAVIGDVINNLNLTLDTVNARDDKLSGLIVSLQQLVTGLAQDRVAIGSSLQPIADLTNVTAGLLQQARPPLADDIVKLGQESDILNRNRGLVENALRNIPQKANNFGRAGSYGSWFNFYLCSIQIDLTLPNHQQVPVPVHQPTNVARCNP
jgi:phospholipid/cholesterol/gamma-HCH transport system substrate-binding protein